MLTAEPTNVFDFFVRLSLMFAEPTTLISGISGTEDIQMVYGVCRTDDLHRNDDMRHLQNGGTNVIYRNDGMQRLRNRQHSHK